MDIFNLNEKVNGLVSYLQDTGYSAMYIDYVKKMAEWLSGNALRRIQGCNRHGFQHGR